MPILAKTPSGMCTEHIHCILGRGDNIRGSEGDLSICVFSSENLPNSDGGLATAIHNSRFLQACDGAHALPVKEDVAGKDGGRSQSENNQDRPCHPGDMTSLEQVLNSFGKTNICC